MEKRDLYDFKRNLTGETIFKGEPIPEFKKIVLVIVIIKNSNNKFLIQKRSIKKDGTYGFTGGHPKSGETSIQGIITETKEELGINIKKSEFKLFNTIVDDKHFIDLYYLNKDFDISSLTLQKEEVDFVEWMTIDEVNSLISNELFKPGQEIALQKYLELCTGGNF